MVVGGLYSTQHQRAETAKIVVELTRRTFEGVSKCVRTFLRSLFEAGKRLVGAAFLKVLDGKTLAVASQTARPLNILSTCSFTSS